MAGVAVIGSGVAGLTAAHQLQKVWPVTLYESEQRLGGHAHTHRVADNGRTIALDTGFLVHNAQNYPNLCRLFGELAVPTESSDMSLSVRCDGCGLEYSSGSGLRALPRQLQRAGDLLGIDALAESIEFNLLAERLLANGADPDLTLEKALADRGFSAGFVQHVVLPLVSIVWSCDVDAAGRQPIGPLLTFLANHGMLMAGEATRWRTVSGGSATYVNRVAERLSEVRTGVGVRSISRSPDGVDVRDVADQVRRFDRVVVAVHPGEALRLLADPTPAEQEVLSALPYTPSPALLHTDTTVLPSRRSNWSSWNHRQGACQAGANLPVVSYHLNRLQNIDSEVDYVVTLGAIDTVDPTTVLARMDYEHPLYTVEAAAARARLPELDSPAVAFAGAYHGWGFHEDGCRSGVAAAEAFGVTW